MIIKESVTHLKWWLTQTSFRVYRIRTEQQYICFKIFVSHKLLERLTEGHATNLVHVSHILKWLTFMCIIQCHIATQLLFLQNSKSKIQYLLYYFYKQSQRFSKIVYSFHCNKHTRLGDGRPFLWIMLIWYVILLLLILDYPEYIYPKFFTGVLISP